MEKKRRESTAGWVFESNEGQSNQEAEVTWRLLGSRSGIVLYRGVGYEGRRGAVRDSV